MRFVDCVWELENIGKRTCEITIEKDDVFNEGFISDKIKDYEYVVIKIPMNHSSFNFGVSAMGFILVETQLNISKGFKDFNFEDRLIKKIYSNTTEKVISTEKELEDIFKKMTPDMFSTDRIYLDPNFEQGCSCRRYMNWMRTEFDNHSSIISKIIYEGKDIGFGMGRLKNNISYGLLGGVFESEQAVGLGIMTACSGFITAHKNNKPFKKMYTAISSNNVPMMQIYNYLQFKVDSMTYVFVKHNNIDR